MWIGNLILVMLNIPLVRIWVAVLHTPRWLLYPAVLLISVIGAYSINHSWFDVFMLMIFGILGLALRAARFETAPLALAFIIAPMFEEHFRRALAISRGDYMIFFQTPISLTLIAMSLIVVVLSLLWRRK